MQWKATVKHVSSTFLLTTTPRLRLLNTPTGVAFVYAGGLQVEFHANQVDWRHPGVARIHHCLLRVDNTDTDDLKKGLTTIGNTFLSFAYLETVVLETGYEVDAEDVQSLMEALRKVCGGVELQHRTADQAHKLALQAKKSSSHSASGGLLSPYWCLEAYVQEWSNW